MSDRDREAKHGKPVSGDRKGPGKDRQRSSARGERPARENSRPGRPYPDTSRRGQEPRGEKDASPRREYTPHADRPGRRSPHPRDLEAVTDIDREIVRLIMRRAAQVSRLQAKGRLNPETEKQLRLAWEQTSAAISRDPRLSREMFALLQAVDPVPHEEDSHAFNLAPPASQALNINLPGPPDPIVTRYWMALAAASGQKLQLEGVTLTDGVIEAVKAFNQLGGALWWEDTGVVMNRGSLGLQPGVDKVIHVGGDALNVWLVLAFSLALPARLKIVGSDDLRFLNLGSVRRFLPVLGVRLTNVVPAQEGLPVRVECSGMVPEEYSVPADVPLDFAAALLLAAPLRGAKTRMQIQGLDDDGMKMTLAPVLAVLDQCGVTTRCEGEWISVECPASWALSPAPVPALYIPLCAALLALPAVGSGKALFTGIWPKEHPQASLAQNMLEQAGLVINLEDNAISVVKQGKLDRVNFDLQNCPVSLAAELLPAMTALAAAAVLNGGQATLALPATYGDETTVDGFLAQLGLARDSEHHILRQEQPFPSGPWLSPSPLWAIGLALAAFVRPNLRLLNPNILSSVYPAFWNLYNTLPQPELTKKKPVETTDGKPARRRIIARGVFGEFPPEPPARDDS